MKGTRNKQVAGNIFYCILTSTTNHNNYSLAVGNADDCFKPDLHLSKGSNHDSNRLEHGPNSSIAMKLPFKPNPDLNDICFGSSA
jgi:hypothetical protein